MGIMVLEREIWLNVSLRVKLYVGGKNRRTGFLLFHLFPLDLGGIESSLTRLVSTFPFSGSFSKH